MNAAKSRNIIYIILSIFMISFPIKIRGLNVQVQEIDGYNRICDENDCKYYCVKRVLPGPEVGVNTEECSIKTDISDACYAGMAKILAYANLNDGFSVSKTEDMLNMMLYNVCKYDNAADGKVTNYLYRNVAPRSNYKYNATVWKEAKSAYSTVKNIDSKKITFSPGELNFNANGEAEVTIKYPTKLGEHNALYKAACEVSNAKIMTAGGNWTKKITGIKSGKKIYVKADGPGKSVTITCQLYYSYKEPKFYWCGEGVQPFVEIGTYYTKKWGGENGDYTVTGTHSVSKSKKIIITKKGTLNKESGEEEKPVGGVSFALYDKDCEKIVQGAYVTNADGKVTFNLTNVKSGTKYCVKETRTANGYNLNPYSITGDLYETVSVSGKLVGAKVEISDAIDNYNITFYDSKKEDEKTCQSQCRVINDSTKSYEEKKIEMEKLYSAEYPNNNGLLNFNLSLSKSKGGTDKCDDACKKVNCHNTSISCLKYDFGLKQGNSFNSENLSCYTDIINVENSDNKVYCLTTVSLIPNIPIENNQYQYRKYSGQLYFDLSEYGNSLLSGSLKKECYYVKPINNHSITDKNSVSDYIRISLENSYSSDDIPLDSEEENPLDEDSDDDSDYINENSMNNESDESIVISQSNENGKYIFEKEIKLLMPEVWASFDGKIADLECDYEGNCNRIGCNNNNCRLLGYGLSSPLDGEGENEYTFVVEFKNGENYQSNEAVCRFQSTRQLLDENSKLNLEFREIDINEPFTDISGNKRNTMTNWCYDQQKVDAKNITILSATYAQRYLEGIDGTIKDYYKDGQLDAFDAIAVQQELAGKGTDCSSNNVLANYYIKDKPNSYGFGKDSEGKKVKMDPKYKIRITQQVVQKIKTYAKENDINYNEFNLDCDENGKCTSKLLTYLNTVTIDKKQPLTINASTKRK